MLNTITKAMLLGTVLTLAGCEQYLVRKEFIETYTPNTLPHNTALQVVDPWPPYAANTNIPSSGNRQGTAIRKYRTYGEEKPAESLKPVQLVVPNQ
ncbi:MAG: hypothetical protein R3D32_02845 [Nitratireductor sp.]